MQEVVKKEIVKLLDTVVTNEKDELVPTRTVTGYRVCIDYQKLNEATAKYHFPLPFMDQMLERLAGNKYFCFLDGFSEYFQIPIDPIDQEKTTFTCPFGTYAYRRMPFGLCNAPATFQRCMLAIFHDMIEQSVEVFMGDFSIFRNSFDHCLNNLDKMLQRCKDAYLLLNCPNWELPFELMCDASDFAVGAILGQKDGKNFHPIYFASKTLNAAQQNYTITEKELMAVVFSFDKSRSYMILLLQEFDIKIKDRKGTENIAADHLSQIENDETSDDNEVDYNFPRETLMEINTRNEP
ncbi:reverse transcriptase domain-containing protein [Tanacetum coccineum]